MIEGRIAKLSACRYSSDLVTLLLWALLFMFAHDGLLWWWNKWVRVSGEQLDMFNLAGITLYKIGVLLFNLVQCNILYIIV